MHKGYLCLVLHAHLPYVRHPEYEYFLEENWLYEAMTETYLPLLDVFTRLIDDSIDFRITLSLSPSLIEMFNDNLLRERYKRHVVRLIELSERELHRTKGDIHFEPVARMYHERYKKVLHLFEDVYKKDIISAFKKLHDTGKTAIITSAATHAFLPHFAAYPQAVKAQIKIGSGHYRRTFGDHPEGFWLPECGFSPGMDRFMAQDGIRFFFLDTHGIRHSSPLPRFDVYVPIVCPSGLAAFGRDSETSRQVWSSVEGYPGDVYYRDFYRDIGFDLDHDHIKSYLEPYGARTYTGLKYYRVTGKTDQKNPYIITKAKEKAAEHAAHFLFQRESQISFLSEKFKISPIINALYDAELFGHWWFEGPEWLEHIFRGIHQKRRHFRTITPSEYLLSEGYPKSLQTSEPGISSWGDRGYGEVWLNKSNDFFYRHLHKATERMIYLAETYLKAEGAMQRYLNQAARELLLSQQSDWAFMLKTGSHTEYAKRRFEEHIGRFHRLYHSIITGTVSEKWLTEIEDKDRIFQDIDYRVFAG